MEIEFGGEPTKEIYFKAIRWIFKPSKKTVIIRVAVFAIFAALYIASVVFAFQEEGLSAFESAKLLRHLFTFLLLAFILVQPAILSFRKASQLWQDPSSQRHRTGRVSPIGVNIDPMKDWMQWETFIRKEIQADYIVVLNASRMFVLLQRSFFQNEQDWKQVQSTVAQRVKEVTE